MLALRQCRSLLPRALPTHRATASPSHRTMSSPPPVDATQAGYLAERCMLVDEGDNVRGTMTKRDCHSWERIEQGEALHRAFSVFAWDADGNRLLLQRRAAAKVTFAGVWTNACCSHPIGDYEPERHGRSGVVAAARRKMRHELGIDEQLLPPSTLHCLTRVIYRSRDPHNREWGEHELDYCVAVRLSERAVRAIDANANEVHSVKFVTVDELEAMLADPAVSFSPWFKLVYGAFLPKWWAGPTHWQWDDTIHDFTR